MSTLNDKAILHTIFNPEFPVSSDGVKDEEDYENLKDDFYEPESLRRVKLLEVNGVKKAEDGDVDGAIQDFTKAIEILPKRPSGYNNRAQALRLRGDLTGAKSDLDKAVSLSCEGAKTKALGQALCQRGMIRRLEGDDEGAMLDFKNAAALGSPFGKQMVVKLNPYAALCNQMLADVIKKVQEGES